MKKLLVLATLVLSFVLSGCGQSEIQCNKSDIQIYLLDEHQDQLKEGVTIDELKEGVFYHGEQNISFTTDRIYYLQIVRAGKDPMFDPLIEVNGYEYDDALNSDYYPEPIFLEPGEQNIKVINLKEIGNSFELKLISEEDYLSNNIDELLENIFEESNLYDATDNVTESEEDIDQILKEIFEEEKI
jgi:hypothetical protein